MDTLTIDVGQQARLRLESIGGDLRLVGQPGTRLRAQAPSKGDLRVVARGDETVITCASSCMIFLPPDADVAVEAVTGDVRAHALAGLLRAGRVDGDVSVRRCAALQAETIAGDLTVRKLERDLRVKQIGGDGRLEQIDGSVELGRVEGELTLREVGGALHADVGGDAHVEWRPAAGSASHLACDGDIHCRLLPGASVTLELRAAGDLDVGQMTAIESSGGRRLVVGGGEAQASFAAGGDLRLRGPAEEAAFSGLEGLQEDIDTLVRSKWEEALSGIGAAGVDAERVAGEIRRAMDKARRGAPGAVASPGKVSVTYSRPIDKVEPVSGEERLAILRMVEQGKISVDQAEQLLRALDGKA